MNDLTKTKITKSFQIFHAFFESIKKHISKKDSSYELISESIKKLSKEPDFLSTSLSSFDQLIYSFSQLLLNLLIYNTKKGKNLEKTLSCIDQLLKEHSYLPNNTQKDISDKVVHILYDIYQNNKDNEEIIEILISIINEIVRLNNDTHNDKLLNIIKVLMNLFYLSKKHLYEEESRRLLYKLIDNILSNNEINSNDSFKKPIEEMIKLYLTNKVNKQLYKINNCFFCELEIRPETLICTNIKCKIELINNYSFFETNEYEENGVILRQSCTQQESDLEIILNYLCNFTTNKSSSNTNIINISTITDNKDKENSLLLDILIYIINSITSIKTLSLENSNKNQNFKIILKSEEIIRIIKDLILNVVLKYSLSPNVKILQKSLHLFFLLSQVFKNDLINQIEIFFTKIILPILDSISFSYEHKEKVLDFFSLLFLRDFSIELFINYDLSLEKKSIFYECFSIICKIANDLYNKKKFNSIISQKQSMVLRNKAFDCLVILINTIKRNTITSKIIDACNDVSIEEEHININLKSKSLILEAVDKFNIKPILLIDFLTKSKCVSSNFTDVNTQAVELVKFIHKHNKFLNKNKLGELLCGSGELNKLVLNNYINSIDFKGYPIIEAMRLLFSNFSLEGESQIVDRILSDFSKKYSLDNPHSFDSCDVPYFISYSALMLQTDLHRKEVHVKMSLSKFLSQLKKIKHCNSLSEAYLTDIYNTILN